MPEGQNADTQLETVIGRVMARTRDAATDVLSRSGVTIDLPTAWGLLGVHARARLLDQTTTQADVEDRLGVPHGVLTSFYDDLVVAGLLRRDGACLVLTEGGEASVTRITEAWRDWLLEQLDDWLPAEGDAQLAEKVMPAVGRIARRVMLEQQREGTPRMIQMH